MLTEDDIRRCFPPATFAAGQAYQKSGRVTQLHGTPDGGLVEAMVQGRARTPYRTSVTLTRTSTGRLRVTGTCSCFVATDCKHVAAALLAYAGQLRSRRPMIIDRSGALRVAGEGGTGGGGIPAEARAVTPAPAPLPGDVAAWLQLLEAAREAESEDYPAGVRKRLCYVLGTAAGSVWLELWSVESGAGRGEPKQQQLATLVHATQAPKFVRPSDRAILRRLAGFGVQGGEFIATLRDIIATGRGRWQTCDGPVLSEADAVPGEVAWAAAADGGQKLQLNLPGDLVVLRLAEAWYADPVTGAMGPVRTDVPAHLLHAMLASPWVPPAFADRVGGEISRRLPDRPIPVPRSLGPVVALRETLRPRLQLMTGRLAASPYPGAGFRPAGTSATDTVLTPLARLSWRYGTVTLADGATRQPILHEGRLLDVARDTDGEECAAERLWEAGLSHVREQYPWLAHHPHANDLLPLDPDAGAWIDFMLEEVPDLQAEGWLVEVADDFPVRLVQPSGDIDVTVREGTGMDWFDLDLGVMVGEERISLVPALLDLIAGGAAPAAAHGSSLLLPLPDGRLLAVPAEKLAPILAPLLELFAGARAEDGVSALRLSRRDAADLAWLEGAATGLVWQGGEAVRALGRQLRAHGGIPPCPAPDGFGATLRAYQQAGLAWLQFLRAADLGGVLADDMGLGKTVQALAHFAVEQAAGRLDRPALVVCPTSLVANWRSEAQRFSPALRVLVLHGPDRAARFGDIASHDLVITTYPLLARDHAVLAAQPWHIVVLDEAQTIKNPLAATSRLARTLQARQRLCLSGTPLENHLGELWSLFDFLMPGFLGDSKAFGKRFRTPIEKAGNLERQQLLARRIAPFLLRRTKQAVAADLPPKTAIAEIVEMAEGQRAVYEAIRLAMHARIRAAIAARGLAGSGIVILDALLKLRQACCDPRLLKLATAKSAKAGSAKLERLMELVPPLLEDGRAILLFSQFTSMLALIQAELDRLGVPYALLTGDTKDRTAPVAAFQGGRVKLFLISLKAGGVGLNLTAADTVIHYDPWWNPAAEDQATDRAHRIGQDKPVFVHRLITAGTIEEKMQVLKQRKQALADGILGASGGAGVGLTEADLDVLLSPA